MVEKDDTFGMKKTRKKRMGKQETIPDVERKLYVNEGEE